MKNTVRYIFVLTFILFVVSCKKEDVNIPLASSVADFTFTVSNNNVAPATVSVENNSVNAVSYFWDYGNGVTTADQNPAPVTYSEPGIYTLSLTVEPQNNVYYNKLVKEVTIVVTDPNAGKLKTLYFTSRESGKVHYVRLNDQTPIVFDFPTGGLYKPYGMGIDFVRGKVYVTDTDGFIYRYDLNGENQEVFLSEEAEPMLDAPYGVIVIDDVVYWGREGGIYTAKVDGTDVKPLFESAGPPEMPLGMAYDSISGKIYFVNDKYDYSGGVYTINLDGTGLTEIIPGVDAGAIALDLINGKLYYADWVGGVFMANLDGSDVVNINSSFDSKFCWGIAVDPDLGYLYVPDRYDFIIYQHGLDGSNPTNWLEGYDARAMVLDIYR